LLLKNLTTWIIHLFGWSLHGRDSLLIPFLSKRRKNCGLVGVLKNPSLKPAEFPEQFMT
jgi:hypothetical protein